MLILIPRLLHCIFFFSSGQPSNVLLILGTLSFIWLFKSYVCKLIAGEKTSESLWWQRTDWRWSSCTAGLTVWVQRHHFQVLMTFIRPKCKYANSKIFKFYWDFFFSLLLLMQILIYTEEFKPRGMNQLPGTFVPRQKMRNLLWKVKRSHWSGRVPLSTPHLVNAIVAEYHVAFFFLLSRHRLEVRWFCATSVGGWLMSVSQQLLLSLFTHNAYFFPPDYLFAAPQSSVPHVDRVPMCIWLCY